MFQQFKNIDSAFQLTRVLSIIALAGSIILNVSLAYIDYKEDKDRENRVYVIANGKLFEAFAEDRGRYWPIEIKDHVESFHHDFFTIEPDWDDIVKGINKALYLADNSAANEYSNLKESGYYNSFVSANARQVVEHDKVEINMDVSPWHFKYTGRLVIKRSTTEVARSLITEGTLKIVKPTDNNPHGLKIGNWRILENKDVSLSK
ncbi:conjugative transposon protein TraK [Chitinophaga niabensis]|uniref:Bacteroides conjugative transposon TraK protein n=1 Tax=Chitinophaga niabensis TaxID=536979 RepID=A0A1N6KBA4_9BACT|nr:conjugative transposon protein TraK [Chitinophaga niabensis]SIO53835.1 Bacteroides conjugative transposon TraK protein [Chitinophaga niabensis]